MILYLISSNEPLNCSLAELIIGILDNTFRLSAFAEMGVKGRLVQSISLFLPLSDVLRELRSKTIFFAPFTVLALS